MFKVEDGTVVRYMKSDIVQVIHSLSVGCAWNLNIIYVIII